MRRMITLWVLLSGVLVPAAAFAAEGCTIQKVVGDVQVMRGRESMPAKESDSLKKGDKLMTGPSCMADMSMNGLAGCRVLAASQVEIASWKNEDMSLTVDKGNVILNLEKLPKTSSFKLETPVAVATVRGTQFWGRVDKTPGDGVTTFAVRKGSVDVMDKRSSLKFTLVQGEALDITGKAGSALIIRPAEPDEMQAMDQADGIPTGTAAA